MSDIIQLLPDSVANQIAAGEVIQRPASAVKELLENAIDSGAADIKLIVKDSGKTLIQVIDNGCGMSETDARMSFERHATSKIKKADDLFNIRTKGFRGEALASIAAIAHVELKTRRPNDEIGTRIEMEGSEVKSQNPFNSPVGTAFSVKNLFYNVPARRNFLKSDQVEFRHILEEFERVAIPHPEIAFSLHHNNQIVFQLEKGSLKQRIVALFGGNYNERLAPIEQETNILNLIGYIGKPEFAKKTRGEQFFFINRRFIKSAYLNHAVQGAYDELLARDSFPSYFILMEVDPKTIDINIHPTKTEIKFEDEKSIYAILRSSVKLSLGKHNITPTIDFNQEMSFANIPLKSDKDFIPEPTIKVDPDYNPFKASGKATSSYKKSESVLNLSNKANWEKLYESIKTETEQQQKPAEKAPEMIHIEEGSQVFQLHGKYILSPIKSGIMIVDQQGAHERILYEQYVNSIANHKASSQQELFPKTIELSTGDAELVKELSAEIHGVGFDISEFGKNTFVINGIPADVTSADSIQLLEGLLETYKQNLIEVKIDKRENIARSMARNAAVKVGRLLTQGEMQGLIDRLFACAMPYTSPSGKPVVTTMAVADIEKLFKK
ncbi:MAG: DNA mismatch repair endonuclease MutL [Bacteroidetes bacterium]|nr:DNA mismatch repair endonuclease MutL [Bacteroidota bacterium]